MQSFGTVKSFEQTFGVEEKSEVNITMPGDTTRNCDITAVCELPNRISVLADAANTSLKLVNESFQQLTQCTLPRSPLDMCVKEETELAVVKSRKVHFYLLEKSGLRVEKVITIGDQSNGIAYLNSHIFVAKKTELFKYSLDGKTDK
ncbi:hypothetical protein DPMN_101077 [Dreissena polymorpha]|uniref:Uncharacterized protein n=1 Tax=Dreissena polymorpha TaxID=45954 RepID=A0A9D4LIF9_DREPO|nr:hypothetical protein DPMN_101077 [Dreissena polymorpha]